MSVATLRAASYILTADLDLSAHEWVAIGWYDSDNKVTNSFKGTFDGDGHSISGLYIDADSSYQGLFGYVSGGTVKNVSVSGSVTSTNSNIGGVVGYNSSGTVENCSFEGSASGLSAVGGIVGKNNEGTVSNCYNTGDVSATSTSSSAYAGGVVGENSGTVSNCYNTGDVSSSSSSASGEAYAGGVVGYNVSNYSSATVSNCYNTGGVSATSASSKAYAGGVAGSNSGTVSSCYNTGKVSATATSDAYAGGVVGYNDGEHLSATVSNCYNTGGVSATSTSSKAYAGGVVAYNFKEKGTATVSNCYSTGGVSATATSYAYAGGVVGYNYSGSVSNCYALSTVQLTVGDAAATYVTADTLVDDGSGTDCAIFYSNGTFDADDSETTSVAVGEDATKYYNLIDALNAYTFANWTEESQLMAWEEVDGGAYVASGEPIEFVMADWGDFAATAFADGDGSEDSPYQIATAAQLAFLAQVVNAGNEEYNAASYILTADLDLSAHEWVAIGTGSKTFKGTFDGDSHTISGLYIDIEGSTSDEYQGLFGYVSGGTIKNLAIEGGSITVETSAGARVGGIAGYVGATISNCSFAGSIYVVGEDDDFSSVGGIVGYLGSGTVENCYNTGDIFAKNTGETASVGGIVGGSFDTVQNCYNTGSIDGSGNIGGIAGVSQKTVANCYNTGSVDGGGIVGYNAGGNVFNCYNTGSASYGVVAYNISSSTVSNCYSLSGVVSGDKLVDSAGSSSTGCAIFYSNGTFDDDGSSETTSVTVGSSTYTNLIDALNAYTFANWTEESQLMAWEEVDNSAYAKNGEPIEFVLTSWGDFAATEFADGDGSEDSPYQIATAAQLAYLAQEVNDGDTDYNSKYYILTADLDLSAHEWVAIGTGSKTFEGTFDGDGHSISGLYIDSTLSNQGLFGYVGSGGTVKNVSVSGSVTSTSTYIGGVVGNNMGTVENCSFDGSVSGSINVGGIVGNNNEGTVSNCYNTGDVTASSLSGAYAGGVVGENSGTVSNCYNTGDVTTSATYETYAGGVVGYNSGTVSNCYNTGGVTTSSSSETYAGGVVGYNGNGTVSNCYNTGGVSATSTSTSAYAGGVVGYNGNGTVSNCYNTGGVSASSTSSSAYAGGVVGDNNENSGTATVSNCYNTGGVSATSSSKNAGGVVGSNSGTVSNCYALSEVTVNDVAVTADTLVGGTGKTSNNAIFGSTGTFTSVSGDDEIDGAITVTVGGNLVDALNAYAATSGDLNGWAAGSYAANEAAATFDAYWSGNAATAFAGGDGSTTSPYQIATAEQLAYLAQVVNAGDTDYNSKYYILTADLDLSAHEWVAIGDGYKTFEGTFDGDGHSISGLYINSKTQWQGLFGYVSGGTVKNVSVSGSVTSTSSNIGGVVGYNSGTVENCSFEGSVSGLSAVGGIVGCNNGGMISNCYNTGDVSATSGRAGGVAGENSGTVSNCHNTGDVSATSTSSYTYAGGVVGYNSSNSTVSNCYNTGGVSATSDSDSSTAYAGGVAGSNDGTVLNCHNEGKVSATSTDSSSSAYAGGVVGCNESSGTVSNCYNTGGVSATSENAGSSAFAGGVVGYNNGMSSTATVSNCYNTGRVSATSTSSSAYAGGVVGGNNENNGTATVSNCYNTGGVSATSTSSSAYAGGVVGSNNGTVSNCYALSGDLAEGTTSNCATFDSLGDLTFWSNGTGSLAGDNLIDALNAYIASDSAYDSYLWIEGDGYATGETAAILYEFVATYVNADGKTVYIAPNGADSAGAAAGTWQAYTAAGGTLDEGNYYLSGNVSLADVITISADVTLTLNGYVIDASGASNRAIYVNGGSLTMYGDGEDYTYASGDDKIEYNGGLITGGSTTYGGGGIKVDNGSLYIYGGTIAGNTTTSYGGGVYAYNASEVYIANATITSNTAGENGGGVYVQGRYTVELDTYYNDITISDNTISGNTGANYGGGLYIINASGATISGNTIEDNTADYGGGLYITNASGAIISNNTISNNTAENGAGVGIDGSTTDSEVEMSGNKISENTATVAGGGVYIENSDVTMDGDSISYNSAAELGGGVAVDSDSTVTMTDTTVSGNKVTTDAEYGLGGGIYAAGSVEINGGAITGNKIEADSANAQGGGVYVSSSAGSLTTLTGVVDISGNSVTSTNGSAVGGGVYVDCATTGTDNTGFEATANFFLSGTPTISDNTGGNVYLGTGTGGAESVTALMEISSALEVSGEGDDAITPSIGVTVATGSGTVVSAEDKDSLGYFVSDGGCYVVISQNADGTTYDLVAQEFTAAPTTELETGSEWTLISDVDFDGIIEVGGEEGNAIEKDGYYYLGMDIDSTATITFGDGTSAIAATLDLNGHTIDYVGDALDTSVDASVITVAASAELTIEDSNTAGSTQYGYWKDDVYYIVDSEPSGIDAYDTISGGLITGGTGTVSYSNTYGGGVYLVGTSSDVATLIMNGGTIAGNSATFSGGGVYSKYASFSMDDSAIIGNKTTANHGGGVYMVATTFSMDDSEISSNTAAGGGGIYITGTNEVTIKNSEISGNTAATGIGGGINIAGSDNKITISESEISGNTAKLLGGGIHITGSSNELNISDSKISGNTAGTYGGGIYYNSGIINLSGEVVISGNTAGEAEENIAVIHREDAAGVTTYVPYAVTISGALAEGSEIGVSLYKYISSPESWTAIAGTFATSSTVDISDYSKYFFADSNLEYRVVAETDSLNLVEFTAAPDETQTWTLISDVDGDGIIEVGGEEGNTIVKAGYYYLGMDIDSTSTITFDDGETEIAVTLDLNGHTIDAQASSEKTFSVITISNYSTLTLEDSSEDNSGVITGGYATYSGGGVVVGGTFKMNGGTISGNTASLYGGGVHNGGTFVMSGGLISGNSAIGTAEYDGEGGGVYNSDRFTMTGGEISGNNATISGGGVYNYAEFTMSGGLISDNTATNGGGVFCGDMEHSEGTFTITGGEISGNTATTNGGGVDFDSDGAFNVSGTPVISGNTGGNVYLPSGKTITIDDSLESGASIGVTMADGVGKFATGDVNGLETTLAAFVADNTDLLGYSDVSDNLYLGYKIADSVVSGISDKTYTGADFMPTITVEYGDVELAITDDYDITWYSIYTDESKVTATELIAAGEYTVVITGAGDYTGSIVKTLKIAQASNNISDLIIDEWTYAETAAEPSAKADFGTIAYSYSTSEEGTYSETVPTAAGTYYVKASVEETTNYAAASDVFEFEIKNATPTVEFAEDTTTAYTYGDTITFVATADNGATVSYSYSTSEDGTYSETVPTSVGTYYVKASAAAITNYNSESELISFTIANATITNTTEATSEQNVVYTGAAQTPIAPTATIVGEGTATILYADSEGEYTLESIPTYTDVGGYTIGYQISMANHTTITDSLSFAVAAKTLGDGDENDSEISFSDIATDITYDGFAKTPEIEVYYTVDGSESKITLGEDDYTIEYTDNTVAGTATITVTGEGNYSGTAQVTFGIAKKALTASMFVITDDESAVYTSAAHNVEVVAADSMTSGEETMNALVADDYSIAWTYQGFNDESATNVSGTPAFTDAGTYTYTITVADDGNYSAAESTITGEYIISRIVVDVPTAKDDLIYNATEQTGVAATTATVLGGTDLVYVISGNTATNVVTDKEATVELSDEFNYEWKLNGGNSSDDQTIKWSIAAKDVDNDMISDMEDSIYYAGEYDEPVFSVSDSDITVEEAAYALVEYVDEYTDYDYSYEWTYVNSDDETFTAKGTYTLTITGSGNFTGTATATYEIVGEEVVPTLTYTNDGYVATTWNGASTLEFAASDEYGIAEVNVYSGDVLIVTDSSDEAYNAEALGVTYSYDEDTGAIEVKISATAIHNITVEVIDNNENVSTSVDTVYVETAIDEFNALINKIPSDTEDSDYISALTAAQEYYEALSSTKKARLAGTFNKEDSDKEDSDTVVIESNSISNGNYEDLLEAIEEVKVDMIADAIAAAQDSPSATTFATAISVYENYASDIEDLDGDIAAYYADILAVSEVASLYATAPTNYTRLSTIVAAYEALADSAVELAEDYSITIGSDADELADWYDDYADMKDEIDDFTAEVNAISSVTTETFEDVEELLEDYEELDDDMVGLGTTETIEEWTALVAKINAVQGLVEEVSMNEVDGDNYAAISAAVVAAQNAYDALSEDEQAMVDVSLIATAETNIAKYIAELNAAIAAAEAAADAEAKAEAEAALQEAENAAAAKVFDNLVSALYYDSSTIADILAVEEAYAALTVEVQELVTKKSALDVFSEVVDGITITDDLEAIAENGATSSTYKYLKDLQEVYDAESLSNAQKLIVNSYADVIAEINSLLAKLDTSTANISAVDGIEASEVDSDDYADIESAYIAVKNLTAEEAELLSSDDIDLVAELYQAMLGDIEDNLAFEIVSTSSVSDEEEDEHYVEVTGLATKVDTAEVEDFDTAEKVTIFVEANKTDSKIEDLHESREVVNAYDIKIYAKVDNNDAVAVQPSEDVLVTIPIGNVSSVSEVKIYHVSDDGSRTLISDVTYFIQNDVYYGSFYTSSFSEFIVTNLVEEVEESEDKTSTGITIGSQYTVGGVVEDETDAEDDADVETPSETETPSATVAPSVTETPSATTAPQVGGDDSSSSNAWIWIALAAIVACGGVGYAVWKKKSSK